MERFAFIIHAMDVRSDVAKKYPIAAYFPERVVEEVISHVKPMIMSHLSGIVSITGIEAEGWFIGCPLSPNKLLNSDPEKVVNVLTQCASLAESLGAKIVGLGALTAVAGDAGITLAQRANISVTTGNSYTVATAVEGAVLGASLMGVSIEEAHIAVVGAAGSIGRTCALLLAAKCRKVTLVGRDVTRLEATAEEVRALCADVVISSNVTTALKDADVVITVTSAVDAIIMPADLKAGSVICDVARPRDVSVRVSKERPDVLVIEGGVVQVPGNMVCRKVNKQGQPTGVDFDFGFPKGAAYACMSETMMLALDQSYLPFTLGKTVSVGQAGQMSQLAHKHGFRLSGFRSFERAVTDTLIASVRKAAGR